MPPYINLMDKARSLVLQDIRHQKPLVDVRDGDVTVILFERDSTFKLWTALVEVKVPDVRDRFYEVTYFLENETAHVTAYRAQETNPYKI